MREQKNVSDNIDEAIAMEKVLLKEVARYLKSDTVRMESLIISYQPEFIYIQKKHSMSKYIQGVSVYGFKDYVLYKTEYCHGLQIHPELALLLSTSGSTGSSKMVRISRENTK